jgi:hypothetical protein
MRNMQQRSNNDSLIRNKFEEVIGKIDGPGDFAFACPIPHAFGLPALELNNGELIGLPLIESQAKEIIAIASRSPHVRRETALDANMRNAWQLDPSQFSITNPYWNTMLQTLLQEKIVSGLGVAPNIHYTLDKLVLFEKGGYIKHMSDLEEDSSVFGTMIIQLPCAYTGGNIVVKHNNRLHSIDISRNAKCQPYVVTYYTKCQHLITEVTTGCRLCLIYKLSCPDSNVPVRDQGVFLDNLKQLCLDWNTDHSVSKLIYLLSRKYSAEDISSHKVNGQDKVIIEMLQKLKEGGLINVYLAFLENTELGGGLCGNNMDDDDTCYDLTNFLTVDDFESIKIVNMRLSKKEIFPVDMITKMSKNKPTGDESRYTYTKLRYRHPVLVFWPAQRELDIWASTSIETAIDRLDNMIKNSDPRCIQFCSMIMRRNSSSFYHSEILTRVIQLNSIDLVNQYILGLSPSLNTLSQLVKLFSWNMLEKSIRTKFDRKSIVVSDAIQFLKIHSDQVELSKVVVASAFYYAINQRNINLSQQEIMWLWNTLNNYGMVAQVTTLLQSVAVKYFKVLDQVTNLLQIAMRDSSDLVAKQCRILVVTTINNILQQDSTFCNEKKSELIDLIPICTRLQLIEESSQLFDYIVSNSDNDEVIALLHHQLVANKYDAYQGQMMATTVFIKVIQQELTRPSAGDAVVFIKDLLQLKMQQELQTFLIYLIRPPVKEIILHIEDILVKLVKGGIDLQIPILKQFCSSCIQVVRQTSLNDFSEAIRFDLDVDLQCSCYLCRRAERVLNDPDAQEYNLQCKSTERKHLECTIRAATTEVILHSKISGRSQTLQCTKKLDTNKHAERCTTTKTQILNELIQLSTSTTEASDSNEPPSKKRKVDLNYLLQ